MDEPAESDDRAPVAILCALPEERRLLVEALEERVRQDAAPVVSDAGTLDGVSVVIAEVGVGKTNAASSATAIVERHGCRALVLSGVAGGVSDDLDVGDIVVGRQVIDTDYGRRTDAGHVPYQPGSIPLPAVGLDAGYALPPAFAEAIEARLGHMEWDETVARRPRIVLGTIASGDIFVASPKYRDELAARWSADAVEMEGAAICGVAERYGLPWLIVRALSDRAGEDSAIDYERFVTLAASRSASVLRFLLPLVGGSSPA